ncbi:MAG TPA: BON domain-containing protein [Egibacteraceae bacterium]|nr:BON domain-containing protein [Egibacteraceae bacterium]
MAKATKTKVKARRRAADVREQLRESGLEERASDLAQRAVELAERVRDSEALAKAQARSREFAALTAEKIRQTQLDDKAAELANRIRESEPAQQAADATERALQRLGAWLSEGRTGEKLKIRPAKRGVGPWIVALCGAIVGYLIGVLTAPKPGSALRDDLFTAADRLRQDTADVSAPPAQKPLEDKVRTRLGEDPRTAELPRLNINVAEGTVFVRGNVPAGFDENAIRDVIAGIDGVKDVDLQVTAAS